MVQRREIKDLQGPKVNKKKKKKRRRRENRKTKSNKYRKAPRARRYNNSTRAATKQLGESTRGCQGNRGMPHDSFTLQLINYIICFI